MFVVSDKLFMRDFVNILLRGQSAHELIKRFFAKICTRGMDAECRYVDNPFPDYSPTISTGAYLDPSGSKVKTDYLVSIVFF